MKKVGFFGGGFDPIHLGHINLAVQMKEKLHLEEVLVVPAYCSPSKWGSPPIASAKDRLNMIHLAIQEIPGFSYLDWEIHRKKPSYTIETLQYLKNLPAYDLIDLYLLLSNEAAQKLETWKDLAGIQQLAQLVVGVREDKNLFLKENLSVVPTKVMDISSTEIRSRIAEGKYVGHLLPEAVREYIQKNQLYRE